MSEHKTLDPLGPKHKVLTKDKGCIWDCAKCYANEHHANIMHPYVLSYALTSHYTDAELAT